VAGRIRSIEKSVDLIGNRTRDLTARSKEVCYRLCYRMSLNFKYCLNKCSLLIELVQRSTSELLFVSRAVLISSETSVILTEAFRGIPQAYAGKNLN
jgi:hypothetical protein